MTKRNRKSGAGVGPAAADADLVVLLARELIARHDAKGASGPGKPEEKTDWTKVKHKCPRCGHVGPVDPDFGIRKVRGVERRQSWCHECRATISYYDKPRKNLKAT